MQSRLDSHLSEPGKIVPFEEHHARVSTVRLILVFIAAPRCDVLRLVMFGILLSRLDDSRQADGTRTHEIGFSVGSQAIAHQII